MSAPPVKPACRGPDRSSCQNPRCKGSGICMLRGVMLLSEPIVCTRCGDFLIALPCTTCELLDQEPKEAVSEAP